MAITAAIMDSHLELMFPEALLLVKTVPAPTYLPGNTLNPFTIVEKWRSCYGFLG